jgi:hypothetical protein
MPLSRVLILHGYIALVNHLVGWLLVGIGVFASYASHRRRRSTWILFAPLARARTVDIGTRSEPCLQLRLCIMSKSHES